MVRLSRVVAVIRQQIFTPLPHPYTMSSIRTLAHLRLEQQKLVLSCLDTILLIASVHPLMVYSPVMNRTVRILVNVTVYSLVFFLKLVTNPGLLSSISPNFPSSMFHIVPSFSWQCSPSPVFSR